MALASRQASRSAARMQAGRRPAAPAPPRRARAVATRAAAPAATEARFIPRWGEVYAALRAKQLETVTPEAASKLLDGGGWVLIDVRKAQQFAEAAPAGSVNVPLYQKLEALAGGFDAAKVGGAGGVASRRRRAGRTLAAERAAAAAGRGRRCARTLATLILRRAPTAPRS
jgi:hypothetical protein